MIVKSAAWPLQQAIFSRLENDESVTQLVTVIVDEVPEGTALPFIQLGDDTINPYDTKTEPGEDYTLTIHVWSAGPGKKETKIILDAILQSITATPLEVNGFLCEGIHREFIEIFNDGQAYHGICRFRAYIKQI